MRVTVDNRTLEQKQADWLHHLPDKFIGCRGDHHDWPVIKPGKLPKGVKPVPLHDGSYQMEVSCRNCGRVRIKTTLPGGFYDRSANYIYRDPEGYAAPKGLGLSKADYTDELYNRVTVARAQADQVALADLEPDTDDPAADAAQDPVPAFRAPFHGEAS
jgi:hypothetical protein